MRFRSGMGDDHLRHDEVTRSSGGSRQDGSEHGEANSAKLRRGLERFRAEEPLLGRRVGVHRVHVKPAPLITRAGDMFARSVILLFRRDEVSRAGMETSALGGWKDQMSRVLRRGLE